MRVVVGGFVHETNTYADRTTGPTDRSRFTELRGSALLERNFAAAHPGGSSIGGFISAASELGYTLVPSFLTGQRIVTWPTSALYVIWPKRDSSAGSLVTTMPALAPG